MSIMSTIDDTCFLSAALCNCHLLLDHLLMRKSYFYQIFIIDNHFIGLLAAEEGDIMAHFFYMEDNERKPQQWHSKLYIVRLLLSALCSTLTYFSSIIK